MQIIFYGHACVGISGSLTILIDPFLTGNPLCKTNPQEVSADYILVTHAHYDHLGDTVEIAKRTGATVVCTPDLFKKPRLRKVSYHEYWWCFHFS